MPFWEAADVVADLGRVHAVALEDRILLARVPLADDAQQRVVLRVRRRRRRRRHLLDHTPIEAEHAHDIIPRGVQTP